MIYKEFKEMLSDMENGKALDNTEIIFDRFDVNFDDVVVYYNDDDGKIHFSYITDDDEFRLTDKALFAKACASVMLFGSSDITDFFKDSRFEKLWTLYRYIMKDNGWYVEGDEENEPRQHVLDPVGCLKEAFKEAKIKVNDDIVNKIYGEFLDGLISAEYTKTI